MIDGQIVRDEGGDVVPTTSSAGAMRDEVGELWQKARLMVCLMAEKRLEREREEEGKEEEGCIVEKGIWDLEGTAGMCGGED